MVSLLNLYEVTLLMVLLVALLVAHLFQQQLQLSLLHLVVAESALDVPMVIAILVVLVFLLDEQVRGFDSRRLILDDQVHSISKFYGNKYFPPNKNRSETKAQKLTSFKGVKRSFKQTSHGRIFAVNMIDAFLVIKNEFEFFPFAWRNTFWSQINFSFITMRTRI